MTFSPDGRRLLTVSLEEGAVTVWKVGSSLSGFFNVGGPPRQGGLGGSGPFKRIDFARVEDGTSGSMGYGLTISSTQIHQCSQRYTRLLAWG